jgi:hypothetical protein
MTVNDFLDEIEDKSPPTTRDERAAFDSALAKFEAAIGHPLPAEYRDFLARCNGGYVGGALWFRGPTPGGHDADAGVHHVGGFREERCFSLTARRACYVGRIPARLLWVMDDPFGNAICIGLAGKHRGLVYFWDHENEPDDDWDKEVESAGNLRLLANSFTEFVGGLQPLDD